MLVRLRFFAEDAEFTGCLKPRTWVEARSHDDMDLFVTIKKIGPDGVDLPAIVFGDIAPHPGARGKMRVSHREGERNFLQRGAATALLSWGVFGGGG